MTGESAFKQVARILRQGSYRGDLCIENESLTRFPKKQKRVILKQEADLLKQIARLD